MNNQLDRISNIASFPAKLDGHVYARFQMGAEGEPQVATDPATPESKYYLIDLHLHSSIARDIDYVQYHLLDPGFSQPDLRSEDEPNDFRYTIETDRDSLIDVTVSTVSVLYRQRTKLSAMLEAGHADTTNAAVREAIDRLKKLGG